MKLTKKQNRDIDSMIFFSKEDTSIITEKDRKSYSDYSDKGKSFETMTEGIRAIINGKMYRDAHITEWKQMQNENILFKSELLEDKALSPIHWLIKKAIPNKDSTNTLFWLLLEKVNTEEKWAHLRGKIK